MFSGGGRLVIEVCAGEFGRLCQEFEVSQKTEATCQWVSGPPNPVNPNKEEKEGGSRQTVASFTCLKTFSGTY